MPGGSGTDAPSDVATRLVTALLVLDDALCVCWMNDAAADLLDVGVRGMRDQFFPALLRQGQDMLTGAIDRLQKGEPFVRWRSMRLTTLKQNVRVVDMAMQPLNPGHWLLEIHALTPSALNPGPLSATLRGVAHEIKNPLTGLRGAAQLLERRANDAHSRQLAGMVIAETDRLVALTNRLLSHQRDAQWAAVNVHSLLQRVRQLSVGQIDTIDEDYDPSLPAVRGDADRLQQLLLNLVRNAIEAGASRVCLRTRVAHRVPLIDGVARAAVRVDVIDNGPGVPDALRERLFAPMVSGRAEGTGLGLALALETARDHGGDLRHADTAEGTIFSLYLPMDKGGDAGQ